MRKIMKPRYRYPLFFLGLFLIEIAGLSYKFLSLQVQSVEAFVIVGFVIFLFSIGMP